MTTSAADKALSDRFGRYVAVIDSVAALWSTTNSMQAEDLGNFLFALWASTSLSEMQGIGFVSQVDDEKGSAWLDSSGAPSGRVRRVMLEGLGQQGLVVQFMAPLDAFAEPFSQSEAGKVALARAAEASMLEGNILASSVFSAGIGASEGATLFVLKPVFDEAMPVETVDQRRAAIRGWVFAPIDVAQGLAAVLAPFERDTAVVASTRRADGAFENVFATENAAAPGSPAARASVFNNLSTGTFGGMEWRFQFSSTPVFEYENLNPIARFQLFMAFFVPSLVALLVEVILVRNNNIRSLVKSRTSDLLEREREIESILANAVVGIITMDSAGKIQFLNPQARAILQLSDQAALPDSICSLMPDLNLGLLHQKLALEQGADKGNAKMLEVGITRWEAESGRERLTLVLQDITEEFEAQEALRVTRDRWDSAMTGSAIGTFDIDLATGKSVVSNAWLKMMGVPDADPDFDAQAHFERSVLEEDRGKVQDVDKALVAGKLDRSVSEYRVNIPGAGIRWMRSEAEIVFGKDGQPAHFVGTQHDITEAKLAQIALQASEDRFRNVFERAPTCNILIDDNFEIMQTNAAMQTLLSSKLGQSSLKQGPAGIFGAHWPELKEALLQLDKDSGAPLRKEIEIDRPGGRSVWLDLSCSRLFDHVAEKPFYLLQIIDTSKLRLVDQVKGEFIATVSHELRTPVTSIKGATELLSAAAKDHLSTSEARLLNIISRNSVRLTELISDILDLEAVQSGQMHFHCDELQLVDLLRGTVEALQPFAAKFRVKLTLVEPITEALLWTDHRRANQCLSNLVSNACKYSNSEGEVVIQTTRTAPDRVLIEVINDGAGIPPEFESKLFAAFSRVDTSDTRNSGGTGLGLKITKELMERMGGRVSYRRNAAGQTVFALEFPCLEP